MLKKYVERLSNRAGIVGDLLSFLWRSKIWWLTPLIIVILLLTTVVVALEGSAVAPFIYTLF